MGNDKGVNCGSALRWPFKPKKKRTGQQHSSFKFASIRANARFRRFDRGQRPSYVHSA